jgi:type VI secretion system secreted protein Hcp
MATVDYFLKIDGIAGDSQDAEHKDEIEVEAFSWGESQSGTVAPGGGGGAGKVAMRDFQFRMRSSVASPKLFLACASGRHIKEATLVGRRAGDRPQQFLKYHLSDVLVSSYQIAGDPPNESRPGDTLSLDFARIDVEYQPPQNADGRPGTAISVGWDLKQNRAV